MVYATTSYNKRLARLSAMRTGRRLTAARVLQKCSRANALCGVLLHHILPAMVFASQSPYTGLQTAVNLDVYESWIDRAKSSFELSKANITKARRNTWYFQNTAKTSCLCAFVRNT